MNTQLSMPQPMPRQSGLLEERIRGTVPFRVLTEFFGTSALFPILDAIRVVSGDGLLTYLTEPSHYALFASACVQAWFLGTAKEDNWQTKLVGNLLAFGLYMPLDLAIEGIAFFYEPYHWLFAVFSLVMALLGALQMIRRETQVWQVSITLLLNISKVALFPAMYFIAEQGISSFSQVTWPAWQEYMASSGHRFIFYGALFFGALLGLAEAQRNKYASFLRLTASQLKQYSEWSLSSNLIVDALDNPDVLKLRRTQKTILFMDIRGFTSWSEFSDPQEVVEMLNRYYDVAEAIIVKHNGHKPNFTADEIMTRFPSAQAALDAACTLQREVRQLFEPLNLSVGIGLNTGHVIEGLMGSASTRKYDIIGDAVNTAKRLESAAGPGEIVMAVQTYNMLNSGPAQVVNRTVKAKGKAEPVPVFVIGG